MKKLFHLDLKGCPPNPDRLLSLPGEVKAMGYDAMLIEWECAFPWSVDESLQSPEAYSRVLVRRFLERVQHAGLEYLPLIQTLGHLEFVLGGSKYRGLRERDDRCTVLHTLAEDAAPLIASMIKDVLSIGPRPTHIHLGGDEAQCLGEHPASAKFIEDRGGGDPGRARLYLHHMRPLFDVVEAERIRPILWSDMMERWPSEALADLSKRADLMAWGYNGEADRPDGHHHRREVLERYRDAGLSLWGATAFRGADGFYADLPDLPERIRNAKSWFQAHQRYDFVGVVATGWTRYDAHRLQVCPLDACWDAAAAVSLCLSGRSPETPSIRALMEGAGVVSRFDVVYPKLKAWSRSLDETWAMIRVLEEQAAVEAADPSRRGSYALRQTWTDLQGLSDRLHRSADELIGCLIESVQSRSAEEYVADRLKAISDVRQRLGRHVAIPVQTLPELKRHAGDFSSRSLGEEDSPREVHQTAPF